MKQRDAFLFLMASCIIILSAQCTPIAEPGTLPGPTGNSPTPKEIRVAVVPPGFTSPFHVAIKDGVTSEAAKLGWKADVVAVEKEDDFAGQVSVVEQELQKGIAVVSVNPLDAKAIVTAVKKANQNGTPIFMHNTITPVDQGQVEEYIGYDQWSGAVKLAKYTCTLLGGKGNVYILMGIPGFHANRRTQGYEWGLQQNCPGVHVVGKQSADWDRTEAINIAAAALQQNPQIDLFYGNSDEMAIGACIAAKKIGRVVNKDVWCISIDGNPVTLDLIEKGDMTATLGVYPRRMGATLIQQMAKLLNGEKIPFILETPSIIVVSQNVTAYRSESTWTEPLEGKPELDNGKPSGEAAK
jgi:ABC-type sugar transport system substrate-binding protein